MFSRANTLRLLLAVMSVTLFAACESGMVYDEYQQADVEGWEKNDQLVYDIHSLKESGTYSLALGLRLTTKYPFSNLHMIVEQTQMPANQTTVDTVTCYVVDKRGFTLGQGVSLFQYELPVRQKFYLHGDSLHVVVKHNMKREILPGISDVGIILKKTK